MSREARRAGGRPLGRPRRRARTEIHLMVPDEVLDALDAVCIDMGASRTGYIETLLRADPRVAAKLAASAPAEGTGARERSDGA